MNIGNKVAKRKKMIDGSEQGHAYQVQEANVGVGPVVQQQVGEQQHELPLFSQKMMKTIQKPW